MLRQAVARAARLVAGLEQQADEAAADERLAGGREPLAAVLDSARSTLAALQEAERRNSEAL